MADYKILDVNGHEMKTGEFFKFVPVFRKVNPGEYQKPENHKVGECKGSSNDWCGGKYIFDYALAPYKEGYGDPVKGNFQAFTVVEDGVRGRSILIKREAMRKEHYQTHDLEWIPDLAEKKPKAVRALAAKAEALWAKTSDEVKAKYLAAECKAATERHEKAPGGLDGEWATIMGFDEFEETLKGMKHDYYLELHDSGGEMRLEATGLDDEDKAIDRLLDVESDGKWYLWQWDKKKKEWFEAKVKRKGKEIKILWEPGGPS
jgi:hypothetical protein